VVGILAAATFLPMLVAVSTGVAVIMGSPSLGEFELGRPNNIRPAPPEPIGNTSVVLPWSPESAASPGGPQEPDRSVGAPAMQTPPPASPAALVDPPNFEPVDQLQPTRRLAIPRLPPRASRPTLGRRPSTSPIAPAVTGSSAGPTGPRPSRAAVSPSASRSGGTPTTSPVGSGSPAPSDNPEPSGGPELSGSPAPSDNPEPSDCPAAPGSPVPSAGVVSQTSSVPSTGWAVSGHHR